MSRVAAGELLNLSMPQQLLPANRDDEIFRVSENWQLSLLKAKYLINGDDNNLVSLLYGMVRKSS